MLRNGILYKCEESGKELYVVPREMRKALVIKNHDLTSHFGIDRTGTRIRNFYYYPRMRNYVRRHIASCVECILAKNKVGRQPGELHPIPVGKRPFEIVNIDHLGPFVTSTKNNKYVLAAVCNLTKFTQLYAVKDVKAITTVRKLEGLINRFGAPVRFITDRGTAFTSEAFKSFCSEHGIKHTLNSSRHAQANGQVERLNQTILPALQSNLEEYSGTTWDKNLDQLERDLNGSVSKTTGRTLFEMLYGYIPRFKEGATRELTRKAEMYQIPEDVRRDALEKIEFEQKQSKERYDKTRYKNVKFSTGDIVYVKTNPISTGESPKLQSKFKGPLVISQVLPSDTHRVQNLNVKGTSKVGTTAHVSQLKLWRGFSEDCDIDSAGERSDDSEDEVPELRNNLERDFIHSGNDSKSILDDTSENAHELNRVEDQKVNSDLTVSETAINELQTMRKCTRVRRLPRRFHDFEM